MMSVCRTNTFYVVPEWKRVEAAAVAGAEDKPWNWTGKESMHPFWAVRRLTQKQLLIEQEKWAATKFPTKGIRPCFNCELKVMTLSAVNIGSYNKRSVTRTRMLDVPLLVNRAPLQEKEELILEIETKEKKVVQKKRTWKDDLVSQVKKAQKLQQIK